MWENRLAVLGVSEDSYGGRAFIKSTDGGPSGIKAEN